MSSSLVAVCELPDLGDGVVSLRGFVDEDAAALAEIWRDPEIRSRSSVPAPSVDAALQWIARQRAAAAAGEAWEWAVVACEMGELVGRRGMKVIDRGFARAAAACWIAPQFRGRRYAARSLHLAARYVFTQGVIRVQGVCETDNTASFRHMTAAGMTYEGTLRSYFVSNAGAIVDGSMFSLVPADLAGAAAYTA